MTQFGEYNTATVVQDGGELASVLQSGSNETATVDQTGLTGGNFAYVTQSASDVTATVLQPGVGNIATVNQFNNAFAVANITQSGTGGNATINQ